MKRLCKWLVREYFMLDEGQLIAMGLTLALIAFFDVIIVVALVKRYH